MKPILLITVDWPPIEGGIAAVSTGLAGGLAALGRRVVVVAPRSAQATATAAALGVGLVGSPLYSLGPLRLLPLAALSALQALSWRPKAVVALNPAYGGLIGCALSAAFKLPYVVYAFGYEFMKYSSQPTATRILRRVYGRSAQVIAISEYARHRLTELGVPPELITALPPGVEPPASGPLPLVRSLFGLAEHPFVLTAARLVRRKGLQVLARAMNAVMINRPELRWVVVGRGPEQQALERLRASAPSGDRVHLLGRVPRPQLEALYREASVFALTPLELPGDAEGFGLVYLEAGAHGLASVASDSGGVPEAVIDGQTGVLAPAGNAERTAQVIEQLLERPEEARRLGAKARKRASELSWTRHAQALLEWI